MPVANNNFGQRPTLSRTTATQPIDVNNAMNSHQALDLRTKILNAYSNMGFRGPAWCLPSGALVLEDVWEASLSLKIDEILDLDDLKAFADEKKDSGWVISWLKEKVINEGSDQQKKEYDELYKSLKNSELPTKCQN